MKKITILALVLLTNTLSAQQIQQEPDAGLAMTAAGMSVFTFGVTLKPTLVVQQYNPKYGNNYVRYDSADRQKVKTTTLLFGAACTLIGIYLQNKKRKNVKDNIRI
jgi:hypothetical protein